MMEVVFISGVVAFLHYKTLRASGQLDEIQTWFVRFVKTKCENKKRKFTYFSSSLETSTQKEVLYID